MIRTLIILLFLLVFSCSSNQPEPEQQTFMPFLSIIEIKTKNQVSTTVYNYFKNDKQAKILYSSTSNTLLTVEGIMKCNNTNVKYTVNVEIQEQIITFYFYNLEKRDDEYLMCLNNIPNKIKNLF